MNKLRLITMAAFISGVAANAFAATAVGTGAGTTATVGTGVGVGAGSTAPGTVGTPGMPVDPNASINANGAVTVQSGASNDTPQNGRGITPNGAPPTHPNQGQFNTNTNGIGRPNTIARNKFGNAIPCNETKAPCATTTGQATGTVNGLPFTATGGAGATVNGLPLTATGQAGATVNGLPNTTTAR